MRHWFCAMVVSGWLLGQPLSTSAQVVERRGGFHPRTRALLHAHLVITPEQEIDNGTLLMRDGCIVAVGAHVEIPADAEITDVAGAFVYPGFIDAGLSRDVSNPASTPLQESRPADFAESPLASTASDRHHLLTPEFTAKTAYKVESRAWEEFHKGGVTVVHAVPRGRIASGWSVLRSATSLPARDTLLQGKLFPEFEFFHPGGKLYPETRMGAISHLRQAFLDARRHRVHTALFLEHSTHVAQPPEDVVWETLGEIVTSKSPLLFAADDLDSLDRALAFAREQELPLLLWGGREAHRAVDRLQASQVRILLRTDWGEEPVLTTAAPDPARSPDAPPLVPEPLRVRQDRRTQWQERIRGLDKLRAARVRCALSSEGHAKPGDFLKSLRTAVRAGASRTGILSALTCDAAGLLGESPRLGTLEPGKLAHVVVWTGPFDQDQSVVRYVYVGEERFEYNPQAKVLAVKPPGETLPSLGGEWQVSIESATGIVHGTFDFQQTQGALSGTFQSAQGNGRIVAGQIAGAKLQLTVGIGAGAQSLQLQFSADLFGAEPEVISGKLKSPFGAETKWSAKRRTKGGGSTPPQSAPLSPTPPLVRIELEEDDSSTVPPAPAPPLKKENLSPPKNIQAAPVKGVAAAPPSAPGERSAESAPVSPPQVVNDADTDTPTELESDRRPHYPATAGNVLIRGGTVLTGLGPALPHTSVLVRRGKIEAIGTQLQPDAGMTVIDATGKYVLPGLIDTHSHIMFADGLNGVNEASQSIVCEVRAADVIRTEDVDAFRALSGGVTLARLLHGSANVIGGQHAVVKLKYGRPVAEQWLAEAPGGVKLALGENVKMPQQRFPATRLGVEATLQRAFFEALDYRREWMEYRRRVSAVTPAGGKSKAQAENLLPPRRDLRLDALVQILDQQSHIHCHCYRADEILMLLRVTSGLGIRVRSLQHVLEGYKIAAEIASHGTSCSTFSDWWAYKMEAYDAIPWNAALLQRANVNVCLKSDFPEPMRHLYLDAAKLLRYGNLSEVEALQTITRNPARELGIERLTGTLAPGLAGDIAIFNGHPLNAFSRCEMTLIDGEIFYSREKLPTAMSPQGRGMRAEHRDLNLPPPSLRNRPLAIAASPQGKYCLLNAVIHPVATADIPRGMLLVEAGKISYVGPVSPAPAGVPVIDLNGLHLFPGLIDAGTALGLTEISRVHETQDSAEGGLFQSDLRAGVAINPDSELFPVARLGGVTTTLVLPNGGVIAGQASLAQLAGWTTPEMVLDYEVGLVINWPTGPTATDRVRDLREFLRSARVYATAREGEARLSSGPVVRDPRREALRDYLQHGKRVFIQAETQQAILAALKFAEQERLNMVLMGGADAWKVTDELARRKIPVILGSVLRAPVEGYDPADAPYATAGRLHEAGILFCLRSNHAANSRNVPFEAALCVAHGLPEAAGLQSVTWNAAKVLGIEKQTGSLAVGLRADLLITDGSPLQPATEIKAVFVAGRPYPLESKQTRLYERYRGRLREVQSQTPR